MTPRYKSQIDTRYDLNQGWIQGWKTDGVTIDGSAASMLRGLLCE